LTTRQELSRFVWGSRDGGFAKKGRSLPVFRLNRAFSVGRGAKAFLNLHGGLTRGVVPDPTHHEQQAQRLRKILTRQKNALGRKDRKIEEQAAEIEQLRHKRRREHARGLKQQRLENFQLRNELEATRGLVERVREDPWAAEALGEPEVGALPDFVIIGAQKGGTSLLYRLLIRHPLVKPAATKELHFFDNNFHEGISWYRRHLPKSKGVDDRKTVCGEATPAYLFDPLVPERMIESIPHSKLVALLRNPVDRAYSQYQMWVRQGNEARSFGEATKQELEGETGQGYLLRGLYAQQIERFSFFAERDQLLVMKSEDFFSRRWEVYDRALEFLGLTPLEPFAVPPSTKTVYPPMDPATRRRLEAYFEPHNQRLYEYLGVDFGW
jgi:hypothetical protein